MKELGLTAYRFSISWSRVLPEGRGRVNQAGLDFYRRLVDALSAAGITPVATLFHWDFPAALDDRGGWLNPDSAAWFADYAEVCFAAPRRPDRALGDAQRALGGRRRRLSPRVLAPDTGSRFEAPRVVTTFSRGTPRRCAPTRRLRGRIGVAITSSQATGERASRGRRPRRPRADAYMNRHYLDRSCSPLPGGAAPRSTAKAGIRRTKRRRHGARCRSTGWAELLHAQRRVLRSVLLATGAGRVGPDGAARTGTDWEVYPRGLEETLLWLAGRYGALPPLRHREWRRVPGSAAHRGRERWTTRCASSTARTLAAVRRRRRARRRTVRGLLRLVAARQPRVEPPASAKRFGLVHVDSRRSRARPRRAPLLPRRDRLARRRARPEPGATGDPLSQPHFDGTVEARAGLDRLEHARRAAARPVTSARPAGRSSRRADLDASVAPRQGRVIAARRQARQAGIEAQALPGRRTPSTHSETTRGSQRPSRVQVQPARPWYDEAGRRRCRAT